MFFYSLFIDKWSFINVFRSIISNNSETSQFKLSPINFYHQKKSDLNDNNNHRGWGNPDIILTFDAYVNSEFDKILKNDDFIEVC